MKNSQKTAILYLLATFSLWGSLYVVSKLVLGKLPTFTVAASRFVIAFITLSLLLRKGGKPQPFQREDWKYLVLIGFFGYFISVGAQLLGTKFAGSTAASLINSMNPISMSVVAAIFLGEKLTPKKIIGILLALAGVYLILGGGQGANLTGVALSVFAVLGWSTVSVLTRKLGGKYEPLQITRCAVGIAAVCNMAAAAVELVVSDAPVTVDLTCVVGLVYMGVFCTGVAYLLWNKSLAAMEAGTCSAFYPVQPLVSALLGAIVFHEKLGVRFFIGAALVAAGVLLSIYTKKDSANRKHTGRATT